MFLSVQLGHAGQLVTECDQFVTDGHSHKKVSWPVKNKRLDMMVCFIIYCEGYH